MRMSRDTKAGFTAIETVITTAIFSIVIVAVVVFVVTIYRTERFAFQQADAINEARKGVEDMVKEIREARTGEDGSYLVEKAADNEFIFFSDINKDTMVERVRYFLGDTITTTYIQECVTFVDGGSCGVTFSDFLVGETLDSAEVTVSVEGDFGSGSEYADVYADGDPLGDVCRSGCTDCRGDWQGSLTFDVTTQAADNTIDFLADASSKVNDFCDWIEPNHAMKARFVLAVTEALVGGETNFKKGVTGATGNPPIYDTQNETVTILSRYVRNGTSTPVFRYFDENGNEITETPARPEDTTLMRLFLIINVDPLSSPASFELESDVQIRNLKTNL